MNELHRQLDDQKGADWLKVIASYPLLVQFVITQQNSLRLAKLIPEYGLWLAETEYGWRVKRARLDGKAMRKLKAWWELIFEIQRENEKGKNFNAQKSVALAFTYVTQLVHFKRIAVDPANFGFDEVLDREHLLKIQIAVQSRLQDLAPDGVDVNATVEWLMRLRTERQPR